MTRRAVLLLVLGIVGLGVAFVATPEGIRAPVPSAPFVAWAKKHAIPLKTAEPGSGFEDLQPFRAIVGSARVVGVGEATHGTREFFQFKQRMLEFLVEEMGFTAFAIEAGFGEATKVNDYVLGGVGDARSLVHGLDYWIWDTEEVVALVEWMRQHNLKPTTTRKVTFYGFDMQSVTVVLRDAVGYLRSMDLQMAREFEPLHEQAATLQRRASPENRAARDEATASLRRMVVVLETNRARFVAASSGHAWSLALEEARVALQTLAYLGRKEVDTDRIRDDAMARNIQWILNEEGPAGRVMVWAHNGHVCRGPGLRLGFLPPGGEASVGLDHPMGRHLDQALGRDYRAIGTAFNQGSFRAKSGGSLHSVGAAGPETFDGVLACVGPPIFALDFQAPVDDPAAARWLDARHFSRKAGITYMGREDDDNNRLSIVPRDYFDAIVFFDRTTAAHGNPGAK
jgi:erythromycin esterase